MIEEFLYDDAFREELKKDPHHYGEVVFLESILSRGMNVVDVGGHTGVTAIAIGKAVGNTGRVYVFEPVPEYFKMLKRNIGKNDMKNMEVFNAGLSSTRGRLPFYKHGGGSGVTASEDAEQIEVEMVTLDDFMEEAGIHGPLHVINMDCEGSELNALKGAINTLKKDHPVIFCEIHTGYLRQLGQSIDEIVAFLKDIEYQVRPIQVEKLDTETTYEECSHVYAWFKG